MKLNSRKYGIIIIYAVSAIFLFSVLCRCFLGNDFFTEDNWLNVPASANETVLYGIGGINLNLPEKQNSSGTEEIKKAVAAMSEGTVCGKVNEKYISPYTANTSYKNVYLKNNTDLKIDLKALYNASLKFKIEKNSTPQVLILHTHATETYLLGERDYYTDKDLTRTTDNNYNMVAIGDIVAAKLNNAGINTLHEKVQHDYPAYNESYSRAANTICSCIKKNPSVKIVIDLHRDSISDGEKDKIKLTKDINGKKAAQIMLVMGSQSGNTKNFPGYEENLKLAVKIQSITEQMYPGLARSISLMPKNYNESLTSGSVLIEIGTDANSLEEAKYSAELLGNALVKLFESL